MSPTCWLHKWRQEDAARKANLATFLWSQISWEASFFFFLTPSFKKFLLKIFVNTRLLPTPDHMTMVISCNLGITTVMTLAVTFRARNPQPFSGHWIRLVGSSLGPRQHALPLVVLVLLNAACSKKELKNFQVWQQLIFYLNVTLFFFLMNNIHLYSWTNLSNQALLVERFLWVLCQAMQDALIIICELTTL